MSRYDCRRCDYRAETADDLADHAMTAGHPLCPVCTRSLTHDDPPMGCERCLTRAREDLAAIVELYALLPAVMRASAYGQPGAPRNGSRSSERQIPGGDALVMLGGGSHAYTAPGVEAGDPPSVAFELSRWEDDWRITRGEPAAQVDANVTTAAGYLEVHARWAASEHPAFDEFATDMRSLRARLESACGRTDRAEKGAPCMDCGELLRRRWTDSGLSDEWTCRSCERVYSDPEYWLAVRAQLDREAS